MRQPMVGTVDFSHCFVYDGASATIQTEKGWIEIQRKGSPTVL